MISWSYPCVDVHDLWKELCKEYPDEPFPNIELEEIFEDEWECTDRDHYEEIRLDDYPKAEFYDGNYDSKEHEERVRLRDLTKRFLAKNFLFTKAVLVLVWG